MIQKFPWSAIPSIVIVNLVVMVGSELAAQQTDVWIGSGTSGIFHLQLDSEKGVLSDPLQVSPLPGAGFLAMHPSGEMLYATARHRGESGVAAFRIQPKTKVAKWLQALRSLKRKEKNLVRKLGVEHPEVVLLRGQVEALTEEVKPLEFDSFASSGDGGAACVGVDKSGNVLMSAQYGGGSTTSYLLQDGRISGRVDLVEHGPGSGVNQKRQAASHPHWVGTSPDNRFLMVPDLGKDAVVVYELNSQTAKLNQVSEVKTPPGSGPRHMKFHTSGKFAYVLNELSLTVSVFSYDEQGARFQDIQVIETLPDELKDKHLNSAAEIRVHPSGKYIYTSNRGHDSITVFAVDQTTGKLSFVEREAIRGAWPRNFNIDPTGKWLLAAGQHSNTLALFQIDSSTGKLTYHRQCVNVPAPICVVFANR